MKKLKNLLIGFIDIVLGILLFCAIVIVACLVVGVPYKIILVIFSYICSFFNSVLGEYQSAILGDTILTVILAILLIAIARFMFIPFFIDMGKDVRKDIVAKFNSMKERDR